MSCDPEVKIFQNINGEQRNLLITSFYKCLTKTWAYLGAIPRKVSEGIQYTERNTSKNRIWIYPSLRDAWHIQNGWIFGKVPNGLWPFKRFYWIITTNLSSSSMRVELRTKDSDTSGWQPHLSSSSSSQSRSLMINGKNIIMISILITFTDVQAAEQTPVSENAVWPGGTFDNDGGGDYDNWWLLW